jgi:hypothetical protein
MRVVPFSHSFHRIDRLPLRPVYEVLQPEVAGARRSPPTTGRHPAEQDPPLIRHDDVDRLIRATRDPAPLRCPASRGGNDRPHRTLATALRWRQAGSVSATSGGHPRLEEGACA